MQKLSRTVLRNSALGLVAQLSIKALSFVFSVLIVRNLGPQIYGQYTGVLAFGAVFAIFSDLGLSVYSVRQVARCRDLPDGHATAEHLFGNVLTLRLILSLGTAVLLVAMAWLTGQPAEMVGAIALSSLGLVLYAVQGTAEAMLSGFERVDLASGSRVVNQLVFVALGAVVLWRGLGYYGLIIASHLGVALMTWTCWRGVQRLGLRPARPDPREWAPLIRASLPFAVIGFALGLSYKFDSVLLTYRSQTETGLYNAVYNLVFSAALLSNVLNTALYPSLSRQAASHSDSLPAIYARALRYLLVLALPIAAGLWALSDQLVPLLFGNKYTGAAPALAVIIWVVPFMFASEFLGYVVLIAGKERYVARSVVISTGINVAANLLLVPAFGFMAAAVMTVVTEAILVGQYLWLLRDLLREMDWGRIFVRPALAAALMAAVVLLTRGELPWFVTIALGAVVYAVLLLVFDVLGKDELRFIQGLRSGAVVDR